MSAGVDIHGRRPPRAEALFPSIVLQAVWWRAMKPHVVVASAAHHGPAVLAEFLAGLRRLDAQGIELSFLIVDDTDDQRSGRLLARFAAPDGHAILTAGNVDAPATQTQAAHPSSWQGVPLRARTSYSRRHASEVPRTCCLSTAACCCHHRSCATSFR